MGIIIVICAVAVNLMLTIYLIYLYNKRYNDSIITFQIMKETIESFQQTSELQFKSLSFFINFIVDIKHYELISLRNNLMLQLAVEQEQEHYENCRYILEAIKHIDLIFENYNHEQKPKN